ncbi:MAG: AMIN domain-containing protein, partial [Candidatus Rokubacteria bacterium]|nr:AMIN domain-containing protein [Candidatus Rokubacteria bacterium]
MEPVVRSGRVHRVVHAVLLAAGLLAPTGAEGHERRLHDVAVVRERGAVVVKVRMSSRPRYVSTVVAEPPRVVVDFTNTRYAWRSRSRVIGQPPVKEIRGRQVRRGLARLEVDLTQRADVRVEPRPDGLHIVIPVVSARAASDRAPSTTARGASPPDGVAVHPPADRSAPLPGDTAPGAIAAIRADEGSSPAPGREP